MKKITVTKVSIYPPSTKAGSVGDTLELKQSRDDVLETVEVIIDGNEYMQVSDGFHTMDELYDHRITLFIALAKRLAVYQPTFQVWRSKWHSDGSLIDDWFIMGIGKAEGAQITYHIPLDYWYETDFAETLDRAPKWDGHTPEDVLERLKNL